MDNALPAIVEETLSVKGKVKDADDMDLLHDYGILAYACHAYKKSPESAALNKKCAEVIREIFIRMQCGKVAL